jgi:hypothetical protein
MLEDNLKIVTRNHGLASCNQITKLTPALYLGSNHLL